MLRRTRALVSILALTTAVAACGGGDEPDSAVGPTGDGGASDPAAVAGAVDCEPGGSLTWYSVLPPSSIDATVAAFEEEFPDISVESLRLSSGPLATRYSAERSAGAVPADVVTISNPAFFDEGFEKGWFESELDLPALDEWPDEYYDEGRATTGLLPLLIGYNTTKVPEDEAPTEWEQLLEPRWEGEMLLGDPRTVPGYLGLAELWFQEYGEDYLTSFADQNYTIVPSIVPGSQQLAAGGASLVVPNSNTVLAPLVDEGAPVAATVPTPTTGVEYVTAISTEAPNSCDAQVFMNYLLTEDGQIASNTGGGTSALGDVGGETVPLPEDYRPLEPLLVEARAHEAELLRLLGVEG